MKFFKFALMAVSIAILFGGCSNNTYPLDIYPIKNSSNINTNIQADKTVVNAYFKSLTDVKANDTVGQIPLLNKKIILDDDLNEAIANQIENVLKQKYPNAKIKEWANTTKLKDSKEDILVAAKVNKLWIDYNRTNDDATGLMMIKSRKIKYIDNINIDIDISINHIISNYKMKALLQTDGNFSYDVHKGNAALVILAGGVTPTDIKANISRKLFINDILRTTIYHDFSIERGFLVAFPYLEQKIRIDKNDSNGKKIESISDEYSYKNVQNNDVDNFATDGVKLYSYGIEKIGMWRAEISISPYILGARMYKPKEQISKENFENEQEILRYKKGECKTANSIQAISVGYNNTNIQDCKFYDTTNTKYYDDFRTYATTSGIIQFLIRESLIESLKKY